MPTLGCDNVTLWHCNYWSSIHLIFYQTVRICLSDGRHIQVSPAIPRQATIGRIIPSIQNPNNVSKSSGPSLVTFILNIFWKQKQTISPSIVGPWSKHYSKELVVHNTVSIIDYEHQQYKYNKLGSGIIGHMSEAQTPPLSHTAPIQNWSLLILSTIV